MSERKPNSKPRKEALFVQVPVPDGSVEFHDVTRHIGRAMPFTNPKETCAMRVSPDVVAFSLLHLTKKAASIVAGKPVDFPRGPLARLERRAAELGEIPAGKVIVEMDQVQETYTIERDRNGVVELVPEGDDYSFELPKGAVKISLFLPAAAAGRTLAIGFIGHPGRPGADDTLRRVAAKTLFSLSQLSHFRVLSDFETVTVPHPPRFAIARRKPTDRAATSIPVWLYSDSTPPQPVTNGVVNVEVDLESANHTTGRLLFHLTPEASVAEVFDAHYRPIMENTLNGLMRASLSDEEIKAITVDIVLGEVGSGTVERLRDALAPLSQGIDLTPSMYQIHPAS